MRPIGYELARRNLESLGIPATVIHGDMFDADVELPTCEVVYSLGLIEHFDDPTAVARAHLRFVKPGGVLAIGAPNLRGLNRLLHRWLSPSILETHHPPSTDPRTWEVFERDLDLGVTWKGYIGGFEPGNFFGSRDATPFRRAVWWLLHGLSMLWDTRLLRPTRRLNSWMWSSYVIAFYRAPRSCRPASCSSSRWPGASSLAWRGEHFQDRSLEPHAFAATSERATWVVLALPALRMAAAKIAEVMCADVAAPTRGLAREAGLRL